MVRVRVYARQKMQRNEQLSHPMSDEKVVVDGQQKPQKIRQHQFLSKYVFVLLR